MKKLLTICLMLLGAVAQAQNFAITATTEAAIRKNIVKGNAANYGFGMINDTLKLVGLTTRNVIFTGSTSKIDIGLGNVDNTSDLNKPVSTATQTALNLKQNQLNGTGFVKATGTTISYDNSTYLSTSTAASTYLPISNPTSTGTLTAPTIANSLGANFATTSGNVGIGTTSTIRKFDVKASSGSSQIASFYNSDFVFPTVGTSLAFSTGATTGNTFFKIQANNSGESAAGFLTLNPDGGNVGIGTTTNAGYKLDVNGTLRTVNDAYFATTSGNVGIGTASPAYKLDVSGTARFTGAATFTGGVISNGGGGISTNTAIGSGSLAANTNGDQNTAIGLNSLFSNTTGGYNSSVGFSSLALNTTGIQNTAMGYQSLYSNTSAIYNSAIGFGSLFSNTTGSYNVAIGGNSGRFISGGSTANTIANNSIFIGAESKALANTQTNQIVIGTNAVGNGSNTTVLGNTSTTQTQIFGNTILSNTAQAVDSGYKLDVNGTLRTINDAYFATSSGNVGIGTTTPLTKFHTKRTGLNGAGLASAAIISTDGKTIGDGISLDFFGHDSGNNEQGYGSFRYFITNPTAGAESSELSITTWNAGSNTERIRFASTGIGIGTTSPNASSILDITSTTKGVLFPRMTTGEINNITSPADGLTVYNTTLKAICFYDSSAAVWKKVSHSNM